MKSLIFKRTALVALMLFLILSSFYYICLHKNNINKDVYLLFNTDKNYLEYTKVAIKSAIVNKDYDSIYHINVLCVDIDKNKCNELNLLENKNAYINVYNVSKSAISNIGNYKIAHYVTRTDLFKFLFSKIFKEDKILYIDSDTLIRKDLKKLFNTDISNNYLGAVMKMEPDYEYDEESEENTKKYFYNCGVLLLNLKKFRQDKISEKLITAKNVDDYHDYQTQRIFNEVIPPDTIKVLSPIYNDIARWDDYYKKEYNYLKTYFPFSLRYPTISILDENAVIIHYSGTNKPWLSENNKYSDEWWLFAKMINPDWEPENKKYEKVVSEE